MARCVAGLTYTRDKAMFYDLWVVLRTLDAWHWTSFGLLLLALEMLAPTGFVFLWLGAGAVVVGLSMALIPDLGWEVQFTLWGVLSVGSLVSWRALKATSSIGLSQEATTLNRRAEALVGQRFLLEEPVVAGRGTLRIGDSRWRVDAQGQDLPAGTRVRVVVTMGSLLYIEPHKDDTKTEKER